MGNKERNGLTNPNDEFKNVLKLNWTRTIIIGLAFFGILLLWQVYDSWCPTILSELFKEALGAEKVEEVQYLVGLVMALDNLAALIMLPIFGHLSDKTHTKIGKRMPYILAGTFLCAIAFPFIPVAFHYHQLGWTIVAMAVVVFCAMMYRNPAVALMPDITPKPLRSKANSVINIMGYLGGACATFLGLGFSLSKYLGENSADYRNNTAKLWLIETPFLIASVLMVITGLVLFFTIKENKVAEEMKDQMALGEEISKKTENSGIIEEETVEEITSDSQLTAETVESTEQTEITSLQIENASETSSIEQIEKEEVTSDVTEIEETSTTEEVSELPTKQVVETSKSQDKKDKLSKAGLITLILILISEFFYFMADNGVATFMGNYTIYHLGADFASNMVNTIVGGIGSVLGFVLGALIASKIGRKWTVVTGLSMTVLALSLWLGLSYIPALNKAEQFPIYLYFVWFMKGMGMSFVHVNSFPMVVELCSSKKVGKFTGFYYASSMAAQTITPICLGSIMLSPDIDFNFLPIYALVTVAVALVIFIFVKNVKTKKVKIKRGLEALDVDD